MDPIASYLELAGKLLLLIGIAANSIIFLHRVQKAFPEFPFTVVAVFPFFFSYKVMTALGKGSLSGIFYLWIAIALNIVLLIQLFRKDIRHRYFLDPLLKIFRSHYWFVAILIALFAFFSIREIYLEYPSDAVIYFQRVGLANQDTAIDFSSLWRYDSTKTFFFSFQRWLVGSDPWFRDQLTLVGAINACLLCVATYRLTFWCTQSIVSSMIAVFLSLAFYGNLQINFYLYKILQGATLAMIIYLESIPILWRFLWTNRTHDFFRSRVYEVIALAAAFWICLDCHQEKVLYFFAIIFSVSSLALIKSLLNKKKPPLLIGFSFLVISTVSLILFFSPNQPIHIYSSLVTQWLSIGDINIFTYWPIPHNSSYVLLDFVCLGLILIVFTAEDINSKYFLVAAIAAAPLLCFLNPVIITGLLKFTNSLNIYRLMTGGIPWIFLPVACHYLSRYKNINLTYFPILFVLMGFLAYAPIFGKYPHLFMQLPGYATGKDLTPVVDHLLEYSYKHNETNLMILSEPYTNSYLRAWPQFQVLSNRWLSSDPELYDADLAYLFSAQISDDKISKILSQEQYDFVILNRRDNLVYQSWLGKITAHWSPYILQEHRALFSGDSLNQYLLNHPEEYQQILIRNDFHIYQRKP
jgi:hypothetical protein